ncbi:MAG: substrate-binding domain-containing protein [Bacteroidetes bacterium]|nr:substrate-binding domain-containing protein [Bacteroidota bacterium]
MRIRNLIVLLVVFMVIIATGLFAAGEAEQAKPTSPEEAFVTFAQDTLNQPWRNYQAQCVEEELIKNGLDPHITDGQGSAERQIANIEDMLVQGLNLLITSPAQEGALTPIVEEVYNSGIPVVLIDRGIHGDGYTTFVHADNYAISAMVADYIAQKMTVKYGEPKGKVVVIEGVPGSTTAVQRDDGFRKTLAERYPKIEIIASQPANYRRDLAMAVMEDYLEAYDQIDAVFTHADEMTMGALYAIENVGRRDEILITSVNGTMEAIKAIMDGRMDCTPLYTNASGPGVEFAMKILNGEDVPKHIVLDPLMIDETNAADFYVEGRYSPDPISLSEQSYTIVED